MFNTINIASKHNIEDNKVKATPRAQKSGGFFFLTKYLTGNHLRLVGAAFCF